MDIALVYNGPTDDPDYDLTDIEQNSLEFAGEHLRMVIASHLEQTFEPEELRDFQIMIVLHGIGENGAADYSIGVQSENKELEIRLIEELERLTGGSTDGGSYDSGEDDWFI